MSFVILTLTAGLLPAQAATDNGSGSGVPEDEVASIAGGPPAIDLAFSGGGFYALNNHAAYLMAATSNSKKDLAGAMQHVRGLSGNSGGSWFLTLMGWSKPFADSISAGDVKAWQTTGYLGQLEAIYDFAETKCPEKYKALCPYLSPLALLVLSGGGEELEWEEVVENLVYAPYGAGKTLADTTLTSPRNPWAKDKSLSFATALLTQQAVLNQRPALELLHKGFYSMDSKPSAAMTTSAALVSPGAGDQMRSRLLAGPATLSYGGNVNKPTTGLENAQALNPLNTDSLPISQAAAASSAAGASGASVAAVEALKIPDFTAPELSYLVRNLAPAFQLDSMTYSGPEIPPGDNAKALASGKYARFADGGYGDNSSVAQAVSSLQGNKPGEDFDIVLFDDAAPEPVSTPSGESYGLGDSGAKLFGYKNDSGVSQECFGKECVSVPSSQLFPSSAALNTRPKWEYREGDIGMSYSEYDVTTMDNEAFGVKAGTSGKIHIFSTFSGAEIVPLKIDDFKTYDRLMDVISGGISHHGGWKYLQAALGLEPVVPSSPTAVTAHAGNASASVTWQPPANAGGAPVTAYTVTAHSDGGAPAAATGCTTAGATECVVTKLKNNVPYRFSVTATNSAGTSPASALSNQITPQPVVKPTTTLDVNYRDTKKLKPGRKTKIVRSVSTNGSIKKAKTHCYLNGEKLAGRAAKKFCKIKTKEDKTNAKIWVKPSKCSTGLKVKTKIVAKTQDARKAKWNRTWKVKKNICTKLGNG